MTTTSARQPHQNSSPGRYMGRLCRAGLALAAMPFIAGWSPPVSVLGSPLHMFFGDPRGDPDLRPLMMTPNDVAMACVRYRSGTVSYRLEDRRQTFSLTCTIPAQKETPANRTRFYFFVVAPDSAKPTSALGKIEVYGSNVARNRWVKFSEAEEKSLMKSIRDALKDDNLIEGPEEGQDAFGHWRICKTNNDINCYPKRATIKPQGSNSLHYVANTQPPDAYLALRTQPNSRQGSRIKIMPNGTRLQVLQRRNDGWWHVRIIPSGEEGWTLSGQGNRQWIECCGTFDPQKDTVATTLEELVQKFDRHKNVLSAIETETRKFTSELRCRSFEYWIKQSDTSEITINCRFSSGGETGESSVTMVFTTDRSGTMSLTKKDYAG